MPRLAGQIDLSKSEAILDAAVLVLAERGVAAPMEEIARRARVSKQTIYNHYGSKAELVRALCERRLGEFAAPLEADGGAGHPAQALAHVARILLSPLLTPQYLTLLRTAMAGAATMPDVAATLYDAGPHASRLRLAAFLEAETAAGRLDCPDPLEAAEFFAGMVISSRQTAYLLGVPLDVTEQQVGAIATEAAYRFLRAYAP